MANMEKCYYCDFDEYGDVTYKHEDVLCRKVGEIQDDSIILFASNEGENNEYFNKMKDDNINDTNEGLEKLNDIYIKILCFYGFK